MALRHAATATSTACVPTRDFEPARLRRARQSAPASPPRCCRSRRRRDQDRQRRPDGRRGDDPGRRLQDAGLPRHAGRRRARCRWSLVVSEIFGVHEHIADVARRFAKLGYLAIAPELFVRQGDAKAYGEIDKLLAEVVVEGARRAGDGRPRRQRRLGRRRNGGDTGRLGITGFCWGGRIDLALRGAQPGAQGRRRLVRPPGRRDRRRCSRSIRSTSPAQLHGAGARPLRRRRTPASRSTRSSR